MNLINKNFPYKICTFTHLLIVCLLINFISTQNTVDNDEKYPTFKQFLSKFHKTYNLKAEYEKREEIYLQNIEHIKNSNHDSYGVNFYADWSEEEMNSNFYIKVRFEKSQGVLIKIKNGLHSSNELQNINRNLTSIF